MFEVFVQYTGTGTSLFPDVQPKFRIRIQPKIFTLRRSLNNYLITLQLLNCRE